MLPKDRCITFTVRKIRRWQILSRSILLPIPHMLITPLRSWVKIFTSSHLVRAIGQRGIDSGLVFSSNMIVVVIAGIPSVGSYLLGASSEPKDSVDHSNLDYSPDHDSGEIFHLAKKKQLRGAASIVSPIDSTTRYSVYGQTSRCPRRGQCIYLPDFRFFERRIGVTKFLCFSRIFCTYCARHVECGCFSHSRW